MKKNTNTSLLTCSLCKKSFSCEAGNTNKNCWCLDLPIKKIPKDLMGQGCLCKECLEQLPNIKKPV